MFIRFDIWSGARCNASAAKAEPMLRIGELNFINLQNEWKGIFFILDRIGNLVGKHFGKLEVIEFVGTDKFYDKLWLCKCDCGNKTIVRQGHLRSGHTMSCGCSKPQLDDLSGKDFGFLHVLDRADDYICPATKKHYVQYNCQCKCGNKVTVIVGNLKSGSTISCGCQSPHRFKDLSGQMFGYLRVIERVDDYINTKGRKFVRYRCRCKCGCEIFALANTLRNGDVASCGNCSVSYGENYVCEILDRYNISYVQHKTFDDCVSDIGYKLSYDVYVPDRNLLVECQGLQHYEAIDFFGGEPQFKIRQRHDFLKRNYAEQRGFRFLELDCRKVSRRKIHIQNEFCKFMDLPC